MHTHTHIHTYMTNIHTCNINTNIHAYIPIYITYNPHITYITCINYIHTYIHT